MKPSGIGGMAVMEGVMMKNKDEYAVAVRKPDNEIAVEKSTYKDFSDKARLFKLPIFRGMLAFVDSMVIGIKVLNYSASFFEEEEEDKNKKSDKKGKKSEQGKVKKAEDDGEFAFEELSVTDNHAEKTEPVKEEKKEQSNALMMAAAVLISIVISVALFMVLPVFIANLFAHFVKSQFILNFIESVIRIAIFIGYVVAAALMPDIKRVFMYHGAEHKTINCLENGFELTVDNVKWQSKQHKRCGTSFMLMVMLISLIVFMLLPPLDLLWRILSRILLVPVIAGISYEFIRLAGKTENKVVNILSKPGLWMQGLTTREPDDRMIEVAIASVDAVFDWRGFLESMAPKSVKEKNGKSGQKSRDRYENKQAAKAQTGAAVKAENKQAAKAQAGAAAKAESKQAAKAQAGAAAKAESKQAAKTQAGTEVKTDNKPAGKTHKDSNKNENKKDVKTAGTNPVQNKVKAAETGNKPAKQGNSEEEDDEILKALDKYLNLEQDTASGKEVNE